MIIDKLFELKDEAYKHFNCALIPTVDPDTVIGVRTPALRNLAKELWGTPEARDFLAELPHRYYEENNLHAFLIEHIRDYEKCMAETERFLPYIDNWATCDGFSPKVFKKHLPELLVKIHLWLQSEHTYTVRFAMGMLMRHYLDEHFSPEYPELVASVQSEEYYIRMMQAWYFATALAKQPDAILPYFSEGRLEPWTHNKAIQKAIESYRITPEQKAYLKTLKMRIR